MLRYNFLCFFNFNLMQTPASYAKILLFLLNVKAYLKRRTTSESLLCYNEAALGEKHHLCSPIWFVDKHNLRLIFFIFTCSSLFLGLSMDHSVIVYNPIQLILETYIYKYNCYKTLWDTVCFHHFPRDYFSALDSMCSWADNCLKINMAEMKWFAHVTSIYMHNTVFSCLF